MSALEAESVIACQCTLGEGPVWWDEAFWWVDIEERRLHRWVPGSDGWDTHAFPERIGFAVPSADGSWRVGLQNGLHTYNPRTRGLRFIHDPEADLPDNRFNDGKGDPQGRLWAGTMSTRGEKRAGSLYRITEGRCDKVIGGVTISNGLAWDRSRGQMYYIDTPTREVAVFDYNPENGEISTRRVAYSIPEGEGSPDGMTIDAEGCLWIALWGGYGAIQVDPQSGKQKTRIDVPAPNVTSCCFGGGNLDTLYITTARAGMTEEMKAEYPGSGNVFMARPGCRGSPVSVVR